jgi:hypothetical protein
MHEGEKGASELYQVRASIHLQMGVTDRTRDVSSDRFVGDLGCREVLFTDRFSWGCRRFNRCIFVGRIFDTTGCDCLCLTLVVTLIQYGTYHTITAIHAAAAVVPFIQTGRRFLATLVEVITEAAKATAAALGILCTRLVFSET